MSDRTPLQELGKQLIDQPLHLLWALACLATFTFVRVPILDGVLAALVLALPRELVDQWPIERKWAFFLALAFFAIGGGIAGALKWYFV